MELLGIPLVALILCGVVLLLVLGAGMIGLLIKLGVIVREARRPPHLDSGDYRLDQGREAGTDRQQ